ncbi:MAG: plasmid stabilization protein [Geminicoccaceae bacterium]
MAQILVRELSDEVVAELKQRAAQHNRSLEAEVRAILEELAGLAQRRREAEARSARWMARWREEGRTFSDSAELLRELRAER